MTMLRFISVCLAIIPLAFATPKTTINGQLLLPDETPVNATKIVLNSGEFLTYSRVDGTFSFYGVAPGIHLLDVHSHVHHFSQVKIQLLEDQMDSPTCIEYYYPGATKASITHPLVMKARARYEYFEPKGSFNPMSLLKNPMMLMMIVSFGMMFLMPKMMENLEPEERERMQKQMEMQKDPAKMFSSLLGIEEPQAESSKKKRSIKKL
jgi:hypothetical protein